MHRFDILDTPREASFDRIAKFAATLFSVPVAMISIVDHDRIVFKSHLGVEVEQIPRESGLCSSAILHEAPTVVTDAKIDGRGLGDSLVAATGGLRFYAGAPLRTPDGFNLGTLCILDKEPRVFSDTDADALKTMAAMVIDQLELRLSARRKIEDQAAARSSMEQVIGERTAQLVQLSRALIKTSEDERRKLAGELHDDMGGALTLLSLKLQELGNEIGGGNARPITLQKEAMGVPASSSPASAGSSRACDPWPWTCSGSGPRSTTMLPTGARRPACRPRCSSLQISRHSTRSVHSPSSAWSRRR